MLYGDMRYGDLIHFLKCKYSDLLYGDMRYSDLHLTPTFERTFNTLITQYFE